MTLDDKGGWLPEAIKIVVSKESKKEHLLSHQKEVALKSYESVQVNNAHLRSHSSTIFAMDVQSIELVKLLTNQFRIAVMEILPGQSKSPEEVYCLQIGLFPLSVVEEIKK